MQDFSFLPVFIDKLLLQKRNENLLWNYIDLIFIVIVSLQERDYCGVR